MLKFGSVTQPSGGRIVDVLQLAMADGRYETLEVAIAYVTSSGYEYLFRNHVSDLNRLNSRWLSSFDWCRSEPLALDALSQNPNAQVRIFDGDFVVCRRNCSPRRSFHPKGFVFSGPDDMLLICGSGNLSRNGLGVGVELDTIIEVHKARTSMEKLAWREAEVVRAWHRNLWRSATPYLDLEDRYRRTYKSSTSVTPQTDDDVFEVVSNNGAGGFTASQLVKIRRASLFWIETGNLTENLGRGNPGNQLMMKSFTRVFFGFPGVQVERKTHIGSVTIRFQGTDSPGHSLEFAHNGMDRLNLPKPGLPTGPPLYDGMTFVFEKLLDRDRIIYELRNVNAVDKQALLKQSATEQTSFAMSNGGRKFGFCLSR
jgi:HKD family nuclease